VSHLDPSVPHRRIDGAVALSRLPSAIPAVVVPDHVLTATAGPVPVGLEHDGRATAAWAWAERAWSDEGDRSGPHRPGTQQRPPTFWLSRLAVERLGQLPETSTVSLAVPDAKALAPVLPLVHDIPGTGEAQVAPGDVSAPSTRIMVHNGVAAWVELVPRDHVRPGTVRISNHLRAITGPTADAPPDSQVVFFRPLDGGRNRVRRRPTTASIRALLRSATERCLRWFFLAPEQSMRVTAAHPDDEHQHVVTLHDVALSRLGVRSGDHVVLRWGRTEVEVAAVTDHDPQAATQADSGHDPTKPGSARQMPSHLAIRVPTALRHMMDMPAASVVGVRRSTRSVLVRNLNSLVIPVASLALAGAALNDPNWVLLSCGAVATAVLGLSRLRMGNNRAVRLRA
jgi:hypothetical protein